MSRKNYKGFHETRNDRYKEQKIGRDLNGQTIEKLWFSDLMKYDIAPKEIFNENCAIKLMSAI